MVRNMGEPAPDGDDQLTALEPAHLAAFRAFSRAPEEADCLATSEPTAAERLSPGLNPNLTRCVYAGERGKIYIVPGPGSLCSVSIAVDTREIVIGHTTTDLAALTGLGHVRSGTGRPTTFVGVLPYGAHNLRIINRADRELRVPLTRDDAYWISVADPVDMVWTRSDGENRHWPPRRTEP